MLIPESLVLLGKEILKSCILLLGVDDDTFPTTLREPDGVLERLEKLGKLKDCREEFEIDGV